MYLNYLPFLFFVSCGKAEDKIIEMCNKQVQVQQPGGRAQIVQRPTVDPSLCFDLDPQACYGIFKPAEQGTYAEQLDP